MPNLVFADSARCWAVAVSMMIYSFFSMAVLKSSSVLYVGSMQMLDLSREKASWPATLAVMLSQLAGPVYVIMKKYISERACLIIGALLCSLPLMGAAWGSDLIMLCALVGVIQGFGAACSEVIPVVVLMRHFHEYRGAVISAMYIITAVSGFVMPVVYEYVRQTWNFRVCLFVMGTVNLSMLLGCIIVNRVAVFVEASIEEANPFAAPDELAELSLTSDNYLVGNILLSKSRRSLTGSFREKAFFVSSSSSPLSAQIAGLFSWSFIHITISRAATVFALAAFLLILLDYAVDRQLDHVQGVLFLTVFTIGDLLSRVLSGSLIDLRLVSNTLLMSTSFFVQGASFLLLIHTDIYAELLVASFLVGLTGGCRNILATVMITKKCDESSLALNLGVMNFVTGILIVFQPALIGYVRDSLGSYEPLLYGFVVCNFSLTATWFIQVLCDCRKGVQHRR